MINFMKYRHVYYVISGIFLIPGLLTLAVWGVKPSIDFTGGTLLELEIHQDYKDKVGQEVLEKIAQSKEINIASIQPSDNNRFIIRAQEMSQEKNKEYQKEIASQSGTATVSAVLTERKFETLGPSMGRETLVKALTALALATVGILLFVWKQFESKKYGICAIIAMFHDTFITIGIFAILGHFYDAQVDTLIMTAILTVLSFSVHDTIVVYDRIRESLKKLPGVPYEDIVNKAINETLGRSVNNSLTIIFMLVTLYLLGGETIKWFSLALLIGSISGTYSSPFVAAPLLVEWNKWMEKKKK